MKEMEENEIIPIKELATSIQDHDKCVRVCRVVLAFEYLPSNEDRVLSSKYHREGKVD